MRKICVVTGTRAEFGLMKMVLSGLKEEPNISLQIIATGAHLVSHQGNTVEELKEFGFDVDVEVDMLLASDSPRAVGQSMGLGVIGITKALAQLAPDILLLLGDRYEALAAAQSAMMLRIPIAHIHGGESTEGIIDEAIRHAITKMSHLHFVSSAPYKTRVIQMGEQPEKVFNVGALGLDNVLSLNPMSRDELEAFLHIKLDAPILLVTYHPVTLDSNGAKAVKNLLTALGKLEDVRIIFTGANADSHGQIINGYINDFCARRSGRAIQVASLGVRRYLSLMAIAKVVIGNSSSGLLEAPYVGVPTVNIGDRQRGRLRAPSVLDCDDSIEAITNAIECACSDEFGRLAARKETPYGSPGASKKIVEVLKEVDLQHILLKRFYDQ